MLNKIFRNLNLMSVATKDYEFFFFFNGVLTYKQTYILLNIV